MPRSVMRGLMAILLLAAVAGAARAQDPASFYKGKVVTLVVGYGPGGGYDVYARVLARVLSKYIPGNPTIVVQNMPGAGSLRAANYLYRAAPKDGTVFGTFARNIPLLALLGTNKNVQFDPRKFNWLGSSSSFADDAYLLIARRDAAVKSVEDAQRPGGRLLIVGSTADNASSESNTMAVMLRDVLGFNIKLVTGYVDSGQLFMAMERGEIESRTVSLSALQSNKPDWIKPDGAMQVMAVFGRPARHPGFPDAPLVTEVAKSAADKRLIDILEVPYRLSRAFAAPPDVPADRAKALQAAFLAAHKDPEYLAEAERLKIDISPISGDEILELINRIAETPPDELKRIDRLIHGGG
jgi:tripartite-type tricarboxylate transporter receptor subunit TctC